MRSGTLIMALYLTSTLAACAQPGPDGPPPGYGQGGPPGAPPAYAQQGWAGGMQSAQAQTQGPPPGDMPPGPPAGGGRPEHMDMAAKFKMANTTQDGRLTQAQAQAGGMGGVARHFAQIDRDQKGYVTMQDVRQWHHEMRAQKKQAQGQGPGPGAAPGGPYPPPQQGGQQY